MDQIFGIPIGQLTLQGLAILALALVVTGFISGRIIPLRTHIRELANEQQRTADYQELWRVADKRGDVIESVAEDLVVVGENMNKVLKALPTPHQET